MSAHLMKIANAAINYAVAYRATRAAKKAWHDYLNERWGPVPTEYTPTDPAHRHGFGGCQVEVDAHGTTAPLCDICKGSEPFYAAYRKAAAKRAGALQRLLKAVPE